MTRILTLLSLWGSISAAANAEPFAVDLYLICELPRKSDGSQITGFQYSLDCQIRNPWDPIGGQNKCSFLVSEDGSDATQASNMRIRGGDVSDNYYSMLLFEAQYGTIGLKSNDVRLFYNLGYAKIYFHGERAFSDCFAE